jgi:outer membrane protein OmpA-like peptidoglycan-associated protein
MSHRNRNPEFQQQQDTSQQQGAAWKVVLRQILGRHRVTFITLMHTKTGVMKKISLGFAESARGAAMGFVAVCDAQKAVSRAEKAILKVRGKRATFRCETKLLNVLYRARESIKIRVMRRIQARARELIGGNASLVEVNLLANQINMKEQIQFEGGCATIKQASIPLLIQLETALSAIETTCNEFDLPHMHYRIEGHTAFSKKSPDGGGRTSSERALAVVTALSEHGVPLEHLHAKGCGDSRPVGNSDANRRVEVHVVHSSDDGASGSIQQQLVSKIRLRVAAFAFMST